MKKLPIGIQTFSELIKDGYLYVDKTKDIYNLIAGGGKYYFFSRPRRFGKSLLISTLKEMFSGNKELFKGLWIYDKIAWQKFPVVHIDLTSIAYDNDELLKKSLEQELEKIGKPHGIHLTSLNYKTKFKELIDKMSVQGRVAVLVDEYDKPIIDKIDEAEIVKGNREVLREFYSILKSADEHIEFVLLTGVSKFSRVSVFSGLNNLNDITLDGKFSTMLGYTQEELETFFKERIERMSKALGMETAQLVMEIKNWYNGYSWDGRHFVYNPFSVLNLFSREQFDNYWFATGTPTFLVNLIKEKKSRIVEFEQKTVDNTVFESFDIENIGILPLLFQTGYLTIKEVKRLKLRNKYILSYPNEEVKEAFLKHLLAGITNAPVTDLGGRVFDMVEHILSNNIGGFFSVLKTVFSSIPYNIFIEDRESYYHTVVYLALSLVGVSIKSEIQTHTGRIDAVLETDSHIYVMEFKLGTSEEALNQVIEKKYYLPYLRSDKTVILLGVGFDIESRNISDYKVEEKEKQ